MIQDPYYISPSASSRSNDFGRANIGKTWSLGAKVAAAHWNLP